MLILHNDVKIFGNKKIFGSRIVVKIYLAETWLTGFFCAGILASSDPWSQRFLAGIASGTFCLAALQGYPWRLSSLQGYSLRLSSPYLSQYNAVKSVGCGKMSHLSLVTPICNSSWLIGHRSPHVCRHSLFTHRLYLRLTRVNLFRRLMPQFSATSSRVNCSRRRGHAAFATRPSTLVAAPVEVSRQKKKHPIAYELRT